MDRKAVIILVLAFLLMLGWPKLIDRIYPPKPLPPGATNVVAGAANTAPSPAVTPALVPPAPDAPASTRVELPPVKPSDVGRIAALKHEDVIVVSNDVAVYTFTSKGGGLKKIELYGYPEIVSRDKNIEEAQPLATLNTDAEVPVLAVVGDSSFVDDGQFTLTRDGRSVRAEKALASGLTLVKEFQVSSNYLLTAKVRFENKLGAPVSIPAPQVVVGTATPMNAKETPMTLGVFWSDGSKADHNDQAFFANRTLGCFPGTPRTEFRAGSNNVAWAAVHNQFFALAVIPGKPAYEVVCQAVNMPTNSFAATNTPGAPIQGYQTALMYPSAQVEQGLPWEETFTLYAGPREYNSLARLGDEFKNNLDQIMGFGPMTGWISKILLLSMNALHAIGLNYGLAIIGITIIIKLLFWPLTNFSTRSMKRMQELAPEMKKIQEKYKDDTAEQQRKIHEFWKKNKINPAAGCLPIAIQIPVFFGFYFMLQSAIELRGASFLWAWDLSQADTVVRLPFLWNFPVNPLPLLMGITMFWQARITPTTPTTDPAQQMQQNMMKYMPLIFIGVMYNMSAGLTLYWTVQNLLSILQMKITNTHDKNKKDAAAAPPASVPGRVLRPITRGKSK